MYQLVVTYSVWDKYQLTSKNNCDNIPGSEIYYLLVMSNLTCWQSCRCKGLLQTFHFDTKICKTNHTREKFRHMHLLGFCFSVSKFLYLVLWQQSQKYDFGNQWEWIYSCFYKYLMKLYYLNFSLFLYIFVTGKSCEKWYKSQIWQ